MFESRRSRHFDFDRMRYRKHRISVEVMAIAIRACGVWPATAASTRGRRPGCENSLFFWLQMTASVITGDAGCVVFDDASEWNADF
jgi:hypothetical protein